ncbi:hypothetical protein J6S37_02360 [Candidatus Saccharibacteria bacterium]|nr:hypothetical protein [Candidatus Saccharibacteria bacterium]
MDGQDYLNQISASNRPVKTSGLSNLLSSKFFWFGIGALILFIIILIIGAILGGNNDNVKNRSFALKLHLDNTTNVIKTYQNDVKSSTLRSYSASLSGILSDTNNKFTAYLTDVYSYTPENIDEKIIEQATLEKDALNNELFEAKINGILDRIYAHKMTYEISAIASEEAKIINMANDETLVNILTTSYNSLLNLYDSFNNYSVTN